MEEFGKSQNGHRSSEKVVKISAKSQEIQRKVKQSKSGYESYGKSGYLKKIVTEVMENSC